MACADARPSPGTGGRATVGGALSPMRSAAARRRGGGLTGWCRRACPHGDEADDAGLVRAGAMAKAKVGGRPRCLHGDEVDDADVVAA